jgi:hypothetical protein
MGSLVVAVTAACGGISVRTEDAPDGVAGSSGVGGRGQSMAGRGGGGAVGGATTIGGTGGSGGTTGGTSGAASAAGGSAGISVGPRTLTLEVEDGPWEPFVPHGAVAVDSRGRVFVMDEKAVYLLEDGEVEPFLLADDARLIVEPEGSLFADMDIGPDDVLRIISGDTILHSSSPREVHVWRELPAAPFFQSYQSIGVHSADAVAVARASGISFATSDGLTLLYDTLALGARACSNEDLSVAPSGVFLYASGCTELPLLRGHVDGSGVGVLYATETLGESPLRTDNFVCSARDPRGGFYLVVRTETGLAARLFHLTETSDETQGFTEVETVPSLVELSEGEANHSFSYCAMAVAPDGSVYIQTVGQLWRLLPG